MTVSSSSSALDDPKQKNAVLQQQSTTAENKNEFILPDGIKLTGNPEADADIVVFAASDLSRVGDDGAVVASGRVVRAVVDRQRFLSRL